MLVPVNPADQQRFTVKLQQAIANLNAAEAHVARLNLQHLTLRVKKRNRQAIQFWRFSAPERGLVNGDRRR